MSTVAVLTEAAWLFVRAEESVRLELSQKAGAYHLEVWGPGRARAVHEFDDARTAMSAAERYQETLNEEGFSLQARAERRGAVERPQPARAKSRDRRRP